MIGSTVSLGSARAQAIDRADMENNPAISVPIWNQYLSQSHKRLFNKLVGAYGNDYFVAPLFQFALTGAQYYTLPNGIITSLGSTTPARPLFKLLGVDIQYSASPTGWLTVKRFEEIERNKYGSPNVAINWNGWTNLRYRLSGDNIEFVPYPMSSQLAQIKYIQKPKNLQFILTCATTLNSITVQLSDVTDLSVGMSVATLASLGSPIQDNTTVTAIDTTLNTVTLSLSALATIPVVQLAFWTDAVTFDGISGWEEWVIIDAAIKAGVKQESSVEDLRVERMSLDSEIESMAEGRDAGQAHHVSDALGANGYGGWGDGDGFGGI